MDVGTVSPEGCQSRYPASLAQTRFWLLDALDPGTPALNVAVRWTITGPATPELVESAWWRIISRHEILRTAILQEAGVPVQAVAETIPFNLAHHDLTALSPTQRIAEADRLGAIEARKPFILEHPPLLRVTMMKLETNVTRMLVTLHHAICDGWSIGVLSNEFVAELAGSHPPELALQYGDFARWQHAWLESPALDSAADYWTGRLADLPSLIVPPDRAADERGDSAIKSALLPRALTDGMATLAARNGCTLFSVALAGLGRLINARTGSEDFAIGTQVAGRQDVELEPMVGCFINTLVLRLDFSGAPTWVDLYVELEW